MHKFVIVAEDATDIEVIRAILHRRLSNPPMKRYSAKGALRARKAAAWLETAAADDCDRAILLRDCDCNESGALNDERLLRDELDAIPCPGSIDKLICIPVEELEAWFWSDPRVLAEVARRPVTASPSPHNIRKPKERLQELSRGANRKPRYSTQDNPRLAQMLDLELCASRCPSMRQLLDFIAI